MKIGHVLCAVPLLLMAVKPGGCGSTDEDDISSEVFALAEDAGEANGAGDAATSLVSLPLVPLQKAADVATATAAVQAASTNLGIWYKPAGCITATQNGNELTYEFKNCTGPLGLVGINGKLVATFSLASGGVKVEVKSQGLKLNQTDITQSATAMVTFSGAVRTVQWSGSYDGITKRGNLPLKHTANYTVDYDTASSCVTVNGTADTTLGARGVQTSTSGYNRCGSLWMCPKAGTISATGKVNQKTISVTYKGAGQVSLTGWLGNTYNYKMLWCVAN